MSERTATAIMEAKGRPQENDFLLNSYTVIEFDNRIQMDSYVKYVIRDVKRAAEQLPAEGPGLVFIGMPLSHSEFTYEFVDQCFSPVFRILQRHHRRINGVVLFGRPFTISLWDGIKTVANMEGHVIPASQPRTSLPKWFNVPGAMDFEDFELPSEGHLHFRGVTPSPIENLLGTSIYWRCSRSGWSQIRAWITGAGRLRVDLFHRSIGRKFVEIDAHVLKVGQRFLCWVDWERSLMRLRLIVGSDNIVQVSKEYHC